MYSDFTQMRNDVDKIANAISSGGVDSDEELMGITAVAISVIGGCLIQIAQELNEIKHELSRISLS